MGQTPDFFTAFEGDKIGQSGMGVLYCGTSRKQFRPAVICWSGGTTIPVVCLAGWQGTPTLVRYTTGGVGSAGGSYLLKQVPRYHSK